MSNVIFEAGDVVTCAFFGDEEFVLEKHDVSMFPVKISINNDGRYFTINGKSNVSDTFPVLKLVRKKQKERELVTFFRIKASNASFLLNEDFKCYEDVVNWIKISGSESWEYQIEKFYKVKE